MPAQYGQQAQSYDSSSDIGSTNSASKSKKKKNPSDKRNFFFSKNGGNSSQGKKGHESKNHDNETGGKLKLSNGNINASQEVDQEIPSRDKIVELLKTHKGSLHMQNYIKKASMANLNVIIESIKDDFGKLMTDSYANYFC